MVEDGVRIDHADQVVTGQVDADIEGVRLAAVAFAGDQKGVGRVAGDVYRQHLAAVRDIVRHDVRDLDEVETGPQALESVVGRAVVDHDDLESRVAQRGQRVDRGNDHRAFVVRRHEQGHRGGQRVAE